MSADNQEEAKGYSPAAPITESQSLSILSSDADATSLPSGENATVRTVSEWPSSVRRTAPVAESQSLTKKAFLSKIHSNRFHQRIYKEAG
jgi:hypothetical protein